MFNFWSKPDPKEEQRAADRQLRKAGREIERDRRELEREEKKLIIEIKKLAKEGNNEGCKVLAKQLVAIRKQKTRTYNAEGKVRGFAMQSKAMGASAKLAGAMGTATQAMGTANRLLRPEQIAATVGSFTKASEQMAMTDEMINESLDDMLNESGDEEETDQIVTQVLDEIGIEISGKIAGAPLPTSDTVKIADKGKLTDAEIEKQLAKLRA